MLPLSKFRGKRTETGQWVYGCLVNNLWAHHKDGIPVSEIITGIYDGDCWEDIAQDDDAIVEVITETVTPFVGIQDKNKKDLYLGDVFKIKGGHSGTRFEVIWMNFGFVGKNITSRGYFIPLQTWKSKIEKVGNIFDGF